MPALPPDVFVNRELSWLEFNRRVLEEAQDPTVPLMERVKFLAIFSSNLDEFFMVRVAELKRRIRAGDPTTGPDGLSPAETLAAVSDKVHRLVDAQHRCFLEELGPILASEGIRLVRPKEVTPDQERFLDEYFQRTLMPVLTPLAIDPGHPFPHLANRSLCLVVAVRAVTASVLPHTSLTVVHIPSQVVPRFVPLPGPPGQHAFMLLEDVIRLQLHALYNGYEVLSCHAIRVTRDADIALERRRAVDLLTSVEAGRAGAAHGRRGPAAVRSRPPRGAARHAGGRARARARRPLRGRRLHRVLGSLPALRRGGRAASQGPADAAAAGPGVRRRRSDVWSAIRSGDVLVHHPYHSFDAVTRFVREAAVDPRVLAIKMTLYRVSPTSPDRAGPARWPPRTARRSRCSSSCRRASTRRPTSAGRARSRRSAPTWSTGCVGYKTHCKACLVVRQERRRDPALLPPGDRQLQRPHRRRLRRPRALHLPRVLRRGPHRAVQPADRLHAPAPVPPPAGRAHRPARRARDAHPPRGRARPAAAGPRASSPR